MALGPMPYVPAGMEQILAQLDNAAILERARNVGLGDLLGGGGAAMPTQPGSIPFNAGYATGATRMPYGYGSLETPTTDALLEAIRRRGVYAGGRGFLKGTGQPLGLPRASLARELQGGMYGAGGSTIGQNVIPMANPSSIPPGAGRGATAANMPYAQWQQASDDLINAVGRQGPYGGTRGWARNSGPGYMSATGYPRQLALPSGQIPAQTGVGRLVTEVPVARPGSIPMGAGRGTGVGSLPYQGPYEMPPVYEPPVRQSTLRRGLRAGGNPGQTINVGTLAESVVPETPVSIRGRTPDWRTFQGGSNGVGAAGFPTADYIPPAAVETAATRGGLRSAVTGAGSGLRGAARDAFGPRAGVSNMRNSGRFALGLGIGMGGGALAEKLGGSDTVAGQFAEGASWGGSFGSAGGYPGAIVGGLGVGLGNVASHAIQGRGIESIFGGGEGEIADTPLGRYIASQQVTDAEGNANLTDQAAIVAAFTGETGVNIFPQLGIDPNTEAVMRERINADLAATDSQEERVEILKNAADELIQIASGGQPGGMGPASMSPADLAAMQVAASQMMTPIAADSMALADMQSAALNSLLPSLPEAYRPHVTNMANQITPRAQQVASAYINQAAAMPQLNVLDQYQSQVDQTAQQLTAQALSGVTSGGATDFASLVADAGQVNGGGTSADIVNQLANL